MPEAAPLKDMPDLSYVLRRPALPLLISGHHMANGMLHCQQLPASSREVYCWVLCGGKESCPTVGHNDQLDKGVELKRGRTNLLLCMHL